MSKTIFLVLIVTIFAVSTLGAQLTVPKPVLIEVYDYLGSYPDHVVYPEEGSIKFKAWIVERPEYVMTDEHPNTGVKMDNNRFIVSFNLGNFPSLTGSPQDWSYGETLRVEVTQTSTGRVAATEFALEERGGAIFRINENAISLQEKPREQAIINE
jgi:hypothetical protein